MNLLLPLNTFILLNALLLVNYTAPHEITAERTTSETTLQIMEFASKSDLVSNEGLFEVATSNVKKEDERNSTNSTVRA